jgi:hypothetical protein
VLPLDRNAKARIMVLARTLSGGEALGRADREVRRPARSAALGFHNAGSGRCFPSYERIAEKADCARSTVYEAIRTLKTPASSPG